MFSLKQIPFENNAFNCYIPQTNSVQIPFILNIPSLIMNPNNQCNDYQNNNIYNCPMQQNGRNIMNRNIMNTYLNVSPLCNNLIDDDINDANDYTSDDDTKEITKEVQHTKKISRIHFSEKEDEKLKDLVKLYGKKNWPFVSTFLKGRTAKQCRDRYCNYLVPGLFSGEWSKEEDELLVKLFKEKGSKWSVIKSHFPNRSSNSLKNRWYYYLRKSTLNKKEEENEIEKHNNDSVDIEINFEDFKINENDDYEWMLYQ